MARSLCHCTAVPTCQISSQHGSRASRADLRTSFLGAHVKGLGTSLRRRSHSQNSAIGRSAQVVTTRAVLDPSHVALSAADVASLAHGALYSLADAAVAVADQSAAVAEVVTKEKGWFDFLPDTLEAILKLLEKGLVALNVPYAYGFSIILLTLLVKVGTYPLTKQQVESTMAMQNLAPKVKAIQAKYAGDQERIQLETARVYKTAGVNPLAGCLPTLATLPVWIGLYNALSNVAKEGILTEGFFWIPSLAGPASLADRDAGGGLSWLFPFVDGAPPLGWADTAAYLVLPVLLVASQFFSMQLLSPPQSDDPAQKNTQLILKFLPLMIGWFSLSVPSGLSLYWFANNVLTTAQTLYLRKGGGATPVVSVGAPEIIDVGQAKRSATPVVATKEEKEKAKGDRFRALKEAEAAKKEAAKKAAEEAARAAAAKAEEDRQRLLQQRQAEAVTGTETSDVDDSEWEEEEGDSEKAENGASQVAPTNGGVATSKTTARRSKRSRRTRRA